MKSTKSHKDNCILAILLIIILVILTITLTNNQELTKENKQLKITVAEIQSKYQRVVYSYRSHISKCAMIAKSDIKKRKGRYLILYLPYEVNRKKTQ